jgi:predicted TIM-barrel fold metal-dependent hydrolase
MSTKIGIVAIFFLVGSNLSTYVVLTDRVERLDSRYGALSVPTIASERPDFRIINGHDHLYMRRHLSKYLHAAERTGVDRTLFVASNGYTLLGKREKMHEMYDENVLEVLAAARENPGKIIPFSTLDPEDPDKLEKLKEYERQGIEGLKLYSGHGNMYTLPLDHEGMLPVYAFCEEQGLPILWHVRFDRYLDEFRSVLNRFPNLKVIVPHFGVAFYRPQSPGWQELQDLLDRYPNLYIDCSFGTRSILVHGLEIVSQNRDIFRDFFTKYSDRVVFGTDMVVTGNKEKTTLWVESVIQANRDWLEKDAYYFYMASAQSPYALKSARNEYGLLRGLALPDDILRRVYAENLEGILQRKSPPVAPQTITTQSLQPR